MNCFSYIVSRRAISFKKACSIIILIHSVMCVKFCYPFRNNGGVVECNLMTLLSQYQLHHCLLRYF